MRKKIASVAIIALIIPQLALAYVPYYYTQVLWVSGLKNSQVGVQRHTGEGDVQYPYITDVNLEEIEIKEAKVFSDTIYSTKADPVEAVGINLNEQLPEWSSYNFWKIEGANKGEKFAIYGLTAESEWGSIWPTWARILLPIAVIFIVLVYFTVLVYDSLKQKKIKNKSTH